MRPIVLVLALVGAVGVSSLANAGCSDPRVAQVRATINQTCTCNGNHGQYVSCVARAVSTAVRNNELDVNCKGKVTRCAARSTCGKKSGFVTCAQCSPGTCTEGHCDDPLATPCTDSSTCPPVLDHCSTKSDAALCQARDGATAVVGSGSCCDASCTLD